MSRRESPSQEASTSKAKKSTQMPNCKGRNIVVTGMTPFGYHPSQSEAVHYSWEVAKLLKKEYGQKLQDDYKANLIIEQLPSVYELISARIPELWKEYNPLLVIHLDSDGAQDHVDIQTTACSISYGIPDATGNRLDDTGKRYKDLETGLDAEAICNDVKKRYHSDIGCLDDAGRCVCEWAYLQSLTINKNRALCITVADNHWYALIDSTSDVYNIIRCIIDGGLTK